MALRSGSPAFLVCSERSGSNLIRVMLDSHPGIVAPVAFHLGRDIGRNLFAFGPGLDDDARWARVADAVRRRVTRWVGEARAAAIHEAIRTSADRTYAGLVDAVYGHLIEESDAASPLLLLKENHTHKQAYFLLHHYPDAKFVFQVRDPRDYLASLRARRKGFLGNKYGSTRHALEVWRDDQLGGLGLLAHLGPERVFLQRYEDLIADPERVLSSLCAFLGLEFDPCMLAFHERTEVQSVARESGPWENLARPVMATNARKYRDQLTGRHIRIVEQYVGHLMDVFGYEREQPDAERSLLWTLLPQITEPWERLANSDRAPTYPEGGSFFAELETSAHRVAFPYAGALPRKPPGPTSWRLADGFLAQAEARPDAPALTVEGRTYSYGELRAEAERISGVIAEHETDDGAACTAILADRSLVAYAGVLAALLRGHAYVPLHPRFPASRNRSMLERSRATALVVDRAAGAHIAELMEGDGHRPAVVIAPATPTRGELPGVSGTLVTAAELPGDDTRADRVHDNRIAYILFTSGSTGQPKGVPVSHDNLEPFVDFAVRHLRAGPEDRFSQTFDITFDLSVFDLFVCWTAGAHLVVPSRRDLLSPGRYLVDGRLTVWFAVPSLAQQMSRQGSLREGAYPDLRVSLFCGEALPADLAHAWSKAAPDSLLENWYGPTEATISCTRYRWSADDAEREFPLRLVPIGGAFPGVQARVFDADLRPVADGEAGELLLAGAQVTGGYLDDAERTAQAFCVPPGATETWYRTGDRVVAGGHGGLAFLGRIDNQTKIQGYRVELGEIEAALRSACSGRAAVALPWPADMNADCVAAAVEGGHVDAAAVLVGLRDGLPPYMVPRHVVALADFPKNASGKVDRDAVRTLLAGKLAATGDDAADDEPGSIEDLLVRAVREVQPDLAREDILAADDLIEAGLTSLGFVSLTQKLEQRLAVEFTQHDVAFLAGLPVADFVEAISGRGEVKPRNPGRHPARTRTRQFIERFPEFLAGVDTPLAVLAGSSGVHRGVSTQVFDQAAKEAGIDVRSVNVGLPRLDAEGLAQVCEFVRDRCRKAGAPVRCAAIELDPMLLSVTPTPGEHEIVAESIRGGRTSKRREPRRPEFAWAAEAAGTVAFEIERAAAQHEPNWKRWRNVEIAQTYLGQIEFDPVLVAAWVRGARALAELADACVAFVSPVNEVFLQQPADVLGTNHYTALLEQARDASGVRILDLGAFELAPEDFLDMNHVNHWRGMQVFTEQLAAVCFETGAPDTGQAVPAGGQNSP